MIRLFLFFSLFLSTVHAATVEVKWVEPDNYRDIHHGDDFKESYRERLFYNLDKHFAKLAEKLPETQHLLIEVLNVDLAGDVHYGGINLRRIIMDRYPPRMELRYTLLSADKKTIKTDHVHLKDFAFMQHSSLRYKNSTWGYEQKMLDDWFKDTFKEEQALNK